VLNSVGIFFLTLLSLGISLDILLTLLNLNHIKKGAGNLPKVFQKTIDRETYQKIISYNAYSDRFGLIETGFSFLLLLYFVYFGGFKFIDGFARGIESGGYYLSALVFLGIIYLIKLGLGIPFELYNTFVIEERYGFNKTVLPLFWLDLIKSLLVDTIIGVPLFMAILWFMDKAGSCWWIWAWIFFTIIQLLVIIIYPAWIAPLFNKFTPLKEGELKDGITAFSREVDFPLSGIYTMDGSKRSGHSNAYFTGLGRKKRIMLLDTLVEQLRIPHVLAILVHEFGHHKLHHVKKNLIIHLLLSLGGFYLLSLLVKSEIFYSGMGFSHPSNYAALVVFGLLVSALSFLFTPFFSMLSRQFEYSADRFALKLIDSPETMAEVIAILSKENLINLNPHPWYSFFHYSHPAPVERVEAIYDSSRD